MLLVSTHRLRHDGGICLAVHFGIPRLLRMKDGIHVADVLEGRMIGGRGTVLGHGKKDGGKSIIHDVGLGFLEKARHDDGRRDPQRQYDSDCGENDRQPSPLFLYRNRILCSFRFFCTLLFLHIRLMRANGALSYNFMTQSYCIPFILSSLRGRKTRSLCEKNPKLFVPGLFLLNKMNTSQPRLTRNFVTSTFSLFAKEKMSFSAAPAKSLPNTSKMLAERLNSGSVPTSFPSS